jgi:uncharacterized membrane protein (UPF0127 family)
MAFERCGSIHTCFMRFAIDVVFLSRDGVVKKVGHALKPYRVAGALFAHWTVELPAGLAREVGLEAGQMLEFRTGGDAEPPNPR